MDITKCKKKKHFYHRNSHAYSKDSSEEIVDMFNGSINFLCYFLVTWSMNRLNSCNLLLKRCQTKCQNRRHTGKTNKGASQRSTKTNHSEKGKMHITIMKKVN